jgi:hypothetical protein
MARTVRRTVLYSWDCVECVTCEPRDCNTMRVLTGNDELLFRGDTTYTSGSHFPKTTEMGGLFSDPFFGTPFGGGALGRRTISIPNTRNRMHFFPSFDNI